MTISNETSLLRASYMDWQQPRCTHHSSSKYTSTRQCSIHNAFGIIWYHIMMYRNAWFTDFYIYYSSHKRSCCTHKKICLLTVAHSIPCLFNVTYTSPVLTTPDTSPVWNMKAHICLLTVAHSVLVLVVPCSSLPQSNYKVAHLIALPHESAAKGVPTI